MTYQQLFFEAFSEGCVATAKQMLPAEQYRMAELSHDMIMLGRKWMLDLLGADGLWFLTMKPSVTPMDILLRNVELPKPEQDWTFWNSNGIVIAHIPGKIIDGGET